MRNAEIIDYYLNCTMSLKIESINICNSNCIFCAYRKMTRKKTILDFDLFKRLVPTLSKTGIKLVNFSPIVGEVLLDPFFIERIRLFQLEKLRVFIFTNIFCLNKYTNDTLCEMVNTLESIIISIAPNEAAHAVLFRKGRYDAILDGLERLSKIDNPTKCKLILQVRSAPGDNVFGSKFKKIIECGKFNLEVQNYKYRNWGGAIENIVGQENNVVRSNDIVKAMPCKIAQRGVVYSSGEVGFCPCSDYNGTMKIGDLRKSTFKEIMQSSARREILQGFFSNTLPQHCQKCTHYIPFDGEEY